VVCIVGKLEKDVAMVCSHLVWLVLRVLSPHALVVCEQQSSILS